MNRPLIHHHCRALEGVEFDTIKAEEHRTDEMFKPAYRWLAQQSDFPDEWPVFLQVGAADDPHIPVGTGYVDQFRRKEKVGPDNAVLFSFDEEDIEGLFSDYQYFDLVLNGGDPVELNKNEIKCVLKPSWNKAKWVRQAIKRDNIVQLITPRLHLPNAKRVWCRNKSTKEFLENMGFTRVEVKRALVPQY